MNLPATEAKVRHVVLEADVLRVVAQEEETVSVKRGKSGHNRQHPKMEKDGDGDDGAVAQEEESGLADGAALFFGRGIAEGDLDPFVTEVRTTHRRLHITARSPDCAPDCFYQGDRVDETLEKEVADHYVQGKNYLAVVGRMERITMVPRMAGLEHLEIDPGEERQNPVEETVEPLGAKDSAVAKFVDAIGQESTDGSVKEDERRHGRPPNPAKQKKAREPVTAGTGGKPRVWIKPRRSLRSWKNFRSWGLRRQRYHMTMVGFLTSTVMMRA